MVDGHLRTILALRENEPSVPVTYIDLNPNEEALALLFFDRITAMAKQDEARALELARQVSSENPVISRMIREIDEMLTDLMSSKSEEDAPEEFESFDESLETEHRCPQCGYEWSGSAV
jgi:hypothetical protein